MLHLIEVPNSNMLPYKRMSCVQLMELSLSNIIIIKGFRDEINNV